MSVTIQLVENGWYQMTDDDRGGKGITRAELLNVLSDIKYLLVRAKFHTDQVEGRSVVNYEKFFVIYIIKQLIYNTFQY